MSERLTKAEIAALLDAAGNVDPCMFLEDLGGKAGERQYDAWLSGQEKLRGMLERRSRSVRGRRPKQV